MPLMRSGSMYIVRFSKQADRDKKLLKNSGLENKTKELLDLISENPFQDPPPFEAFVGRLRGYYSRRINIQHRLVYRIEKKEVVFEGIHYDGTVYVARMWTHYEGI